MSMAELFSTGFIADIILAFMALEAIALVLYKLKTNRGFTPASVFWMLLPGACLVLALRAVLVGASWQWVALAVSVSLIAHLGYLRQRLRNGAR
jgi:hypothetical protein